MEALQNLIVLSLAITVGMVGGIAGGCKIHFLRVREAVKLIEGHLEVTVRHEWADRLWLRLFLLTAGVVIVIFGWQLPFCNSLGLFLLTLVTAYWITRARRADRSIVDFT